jgi:hypothetical protein
LDKLRAWKLLQNLFFVILNGVKDLELVGRTIFFAPLRMTRAEDGWFATAYRTQLALSIQPNKINSIFPGFF